MTQSHQHARRAPEDSSAQTSATPSVHPTEPSTEQEGAPGTNTRNQQQHLHQNVKGGQAQQHPESPAGQHATGSFTNEKKR
jgi:hypothetical protein